MKELSRKMRKQAREFIQIAYTRELNHHLTELASKFNEWRNKKIDCWDLNDFIHQYHDGASRDVYKTYNSNTNEIYLIARAIVQGYLLVDELPEELLVPSQTLVSQFEKNKNINE